MSLSSFLSFISSIGFFIYGMSLLSESLQNLAETKPDKLLGKVTDKPLMSVFLGAIATGIVQSSTATTLMTMGLLEAGLLSIFQALPVVMGANIGTTVTAQIIKLADIDTSFPIFSILKPSYLAPFFIFIGAFQKLFFKKREVLQSASLFLGAGILFYGMNLMENSLQPLADPEIFPRILFSFSNPFLLFLCGIILTAVLQSSSVSVGILQAVSAAGLISFADAVPILLGMNIGKCLPEFVASLGMSRKVKVLMVSDLIVNLSGCVIFGVILIFLPDDIFNMQSTRTLIANFHTIFNVTSTLLILPFCKNIIKFSERIIKPSAKQHPSAR